MNKQSYRAKKADGAWDDISDQEEAAGIRARQRRERKIPFGPKLGIKEKCGVARRTLDMIVEYFDTRRDDITPDFFQKLVDGRDVCDWVTKH